MELNEIVNVTKKTWKAESTEGYMPKDIELLYAALGIGSEAGEMQNVVKKFFRKRYYTSGHAQNDEDFIPNVKEEIADILYYVSRVADILGIDIEEAFNEKMKENEDRYMKAGK